MPTTTITAPSEDASNNSLLTRLLGRLLSPLARLCLANGITLATVGELLKRAFVQEANALQPGAPRHGTVSRISTATGLTRREVTRLMSAETATRSRKPPISTEIFARWTTDPGYHNHDGLPAALKRQGAAPSFEALAQSITRDVHPRSMLDELIRLGLVEHDEELDSVSLTRTEFVPRGDSRQMLELLGDNVGDHLDAAVTNVLQDGSRHLEQAVFADELSRESLQKLRPLVAEQWKALRDAMVPVITALIESDRVAGRLQDQRIRIGLYSFDQSMSNNETAPTPPPLQHRNKNTPRRNPNMNNVIVSPREHGWRSVSLMLLLSVLLAGCGSSAGSFTNAGVGTGGTGSLAKSITGKVIDGYLHNAFVFMDKHGNYQWDGVEPSATTDTNGAYTLKVDPADVGKYPLVAQSIKDITIDNDTQQPLAYSYILSRPKENVSDMNGNNHITPLTSLLRELMETGIYTSRQQAMEAVQTRMGLTSGTDVMADYIATSNTTMHSTAQNITTLMGNQMGLVLGISGSTTTVDVNRYRGMMGTIFSSLSTVSGSNAQTGMSNLDSSMSTLLSGIPPANMAQPYHNMSTAFRGRMGRMTGR